MTPDALTPDALQERLAALPPDAPLVFRTAQGEIRGGYHVTELKLAEINSIDCAARQSRWRELTLQLLDGAGGAHMPARKLQGILAQSARHLDGVGHTPMRVEFAHDNSGMRIHQLAPPRFEAGRVVIDLVEARPA